VHQGDEPKSEAFPPEITDALTKVASSGAVARTTAEIPGSRRMELRAKS
jgi:hypothetical protein